MDQQMKNIRDYLNHEKKRLEERLCSNNHFGLEQGMNDSLGELSGYDNHPADIGTELYERGKDIALNEEAEEELQEVNDALFRLAQGTYGQCLACGDPIRYERLEAKPTAAYCIDHEPDSHSSMRRPVEEKVIHPSFGEHGQDGSEETGFDAEDAWQEVERYGTSNPPAFSTEEDEPHGYVDDFEGFTVTDLHGNTEEISEITHNAAYRRAEEEYKAHLHPEE
ncbi:TraR/DksA C4-type zinc finger protein [Mechercharimyces sp. CAU 1602]|uniref:TraR/DksA C4-type zinc finger protein n=1 Tax=Mechercharimyces sp. CAU 1602 TaxID=2973933 RepID=UPI002163FD19|nr:TraR/DksA C4-type zinc finger protein [Mechercharimyces sp. CAU 1602]MCS1350643.1 TraR/DksA C4-type zinc finger protein [Mechercharimyces sp. CAU 1602]